MILVFMIVIGKRSLTTKRRSGSGKHAKPGPFPIRKTSYNQLFQLILFEWKGFNGGVWPRLGNSLLQCNSNSGDLPGSKSLM